MPTPNVLLLSAMLKLGQNPKSIKSMTLPKNILSMRLPIAPPNKNPSAIG